MEYLKVWTSFLEIMEPLTDAEKGRLFEAMLRYAEDGTPPDFEGNERFVWPAAKQAIDRTSEKAEIYRNNRIKSKQNETNENKTEQIGTKQNKVEQSETAYSIKKYKDKEKKDKEILKREVQREAAARFSPPTIEEVAEYVKERGSGVNAERFVDFYASKGWKVGSQPMKDWRAAVRTWEKRDDRSETGTGGRGPKAVNAQMYTQRQYSEEQLDELSDGDREILRRLEAAGA